jgi:hypothetical protein
VSGGIRNFQDQKKLAAAPAGSAQKMKLQAEFTDAISPRDGAQTH